MDKRVPEAEVKRRSATKTLFGGPHISIPLYVHDPVPPMAHAPLWFIDLSINAATISVGIVALFYEREKEDLNIAVKVAIIGLCGNCERYLTY